MFAVLLAFVMARATSDCNVGVNTEVCQKFSGHLSSELLQVQDSTANVMLEPIGRTYVTNNLDDTITWFKKMLLAVETPVNVSYRPTCARARTVMWKSVEITLVQYKDGHVGDFIDAAENQWNDVSTGHYDYTRWIDNHDGFNLAEDAINKTFLVDGDFKIQNGGVFSRILVPNTCWTMELSGRVAIEYGMEMPLKRTFNTASADFKCRVDDHSKMSSSRFWWKSTFASVDPVAAGDFSETNLYATRLTSKYPLGGNCTLSTWMQLPHSGYHLHFARTSPCETPSPNIEDWVAQQEKIRSLESGKFDQHMSNNLILWANTLDPIVHKLKSASLPFLVLELSPGHYGLYVSIPRNAIMLQIRSTRLTTDTSHYHVFDACGGM